MNSRQSDSVLDLYRMKIGQGEFKAVYSISKSAYRNINI